jgi:hypothetical protein
MPGTYPINRGNRDYAVRLGCERGLYDFLQDYAKDMGMSASAAVRRLVLIGARCEKEHGKARMPATYSNLEPPNMDAIMEELADGKFNHWDE